MKTAKEIKAKIQAENKARYDELLKQQMEALEALIEEMYEQSKTEAILEGYAYGELKIELFQALDDAGYSHTNVNYKLKVMVK